MSGKETQNEKIELIKKEWAEEVRKIKEEDVKGFNHEKANREYDRLRDIYLPKILSLM